MTFLDSALAIGVLGGLFLLAYASIRGKDLIDILTEIRDIIKGKAEDIKDGGVVKYG